MANHTTTREDGSQVTLGGVWGDIAEESVESGLTFDPTFKSNVQTDVQEIPQIAHTPVEVVIQSAVSSISATPATANLDVSDGTTQQLTVTDNDSVDRTEDAAYESSDPAVATVNGTGLISPVAAGSATVTARYGGKTDTVAVTVIA